MGVNLVEYLLHLLTDWVDEQLPATNILRLIYQGRFLHGNVTLGGLYVFGSVWFVYDCLFMYTGVKPQYASLTLSLAAYYWPDLPVLAAILDNL